jgi:S-adenosylmethionine-diacylglycerol 3-amino-3-carboxypropyl transferase
MTYAPTLPDHRPVRPGAAVHQNPAFTPTGLLERLFSRLFQGLVYAQIWEDPVADMAALDIRPTDRMVCIASGGCNVMSYLTARPETITAVDLSPAHVALLRLKLAAAQHLPDHAAFYSLFGQADQPGNAALFDRWIAPRLDPETRAFWQARRGLGRRIDLFGRNFYRFGVLGRFIGAAHLVARLAGVDFRPYLAATTLEEQRAWFDAVIVPLFDRPTVRFLARRRATLFGLGIPPAQFDKLAADGEIVVVLRERLRKLLCDYPLNETYFAWQALHRGYAPGGGAVPPYLEARHFEVVRSLAGRVLPINAGLTDHLTGLPAGSRDTYVLLDAQDWMDDAQLNALWRQIDRTAAPGARVLFRTGGAADILPGRVAPALLDRWRREDARSAAAFAADRSAIYGGVHLYRRRD